PRTPWTAGSLRVPVPTHRVQHPSLPFRGHPWPGPDVLVQLGATTVAFLDTHPSVAPERTSSPISPAHRDARRRHRRRTVEILGMKKGGAGEARNPVHGLLSDSPTPPQRCPAATYSPTPSRVQYHRRSRA